LTAAIAALAVLAGVAAPTWAMARWKRNEGAGAVEVLTFAMAGPAAMVPLLWALSTIRGLSPLTTLLAGALTAALIVPMKRRPSSDGAATAAAPWRQLAAIALAAAALATIAFLPQGMQRDDGVHRIAMHDWQKHLLVTHELVGAATVPPANPFLRASGTTPYYAGFHLLAAALTQAVGSSAAVFLALTLLALLSLLLVPLVAYVLADGLFDDTRTALLAAAATTLLAGFDFAILALDTLLAAVTEWSGALTFAGLRELVPSTHLDYWIHHNARQLNAPLMTALWAPQHLLAACLAVLCLHQISRHGLKQWRDVLPVVPLLAAVPLLSAYVGLVLAVALGAAWLTLTAVRERAHWLALAVSATVLLAPFIRGLAAGSSPPLGIRISPAGSWINGALFTSLLGDHVVARLLDTPALLVVEFGVIGLLGTLGVRRCLSECRSGHVVRLVWAAGLAVAVGILVRPPFDEPNNVYARGLLLAWFILAAFGAHEWRRRPHNWAWRIATVVCLLGTVFTPIGLLLEGVSFRGTPADAIATIEQLHAATPPDAIVAIPEGALSGQAFFLRRRLLSYDERHARIFGAPEGAYEATMTAFADAIASPLPPNAARRLRALDVDVLLSPRDQLLPTWLDSPCLPVVAASGDWVALRVAPDCGS